MTGNLSANNVNTSKVTFNNNRVILDATGMISATNANFAYIAPMTQMTYQSSTNNQPSTGIMIYNPSDASLTYGYNIMLENRTVANLPTGALGNLTSQKGMKMFVSDANSTTFYNVVGGGGSNYVPVFCDGTNWRIG